MVIQNNIRSESLKSVSVSWYMYLYKIWFISHFSDFCHVSQLLLHKCCLKCYQHEESENTVIPILVQTPQTHTKHLEDKERCCGPLLKQLHELWNIHLHTKRKKQNSITCNGRVKKPEFYKQALFFHHRKNQNIFFRLTIF